jgi:HAD superfamily hydrolase (TIGR01458 family)
MVSKVTSVLFDIEGTIHSNGEWIEGALETILWLISSKINVRFITNKTNTNQETIKDLFEDIPFSIPQNWIYTPVFTAKQWFLRSNPRGKILPLVHSSVIRDLEGLRLTQDANAEYVLLGNMDDEWNIHSLNTALRALLKGAKLTTLEMNKSWVADDGHRLLTGPFVKALEYASDKKCEVTFGKPSKVLFNTVLADINTTATETLMVGDDLEADIIGATEIGIRGFLVKTGRFSGDKITGYNGLIEVADSVASLKTYLEGL